MQCLSFTYCGFLYIHIFVFLHFFISNINCFLFPSPSQSLIKCMRITTEMIRPQSHTEKTKKLNSFCFDNFYPITLTLCSRRLPLDPKSITPRPLFLFLNSLTSCGAPFGIFTSYRYNFSRHPSGDRKRVVTVPPTTLAPSPLSPWPLPKAPSDP